MRISSLFWFLEPEPYKAEIQDQSQVKADYKYWRMRIFYSMYVGYVVYYFTRKSFTFAMPMLMQELHLTKSDLGWVSTAFYITYGVSKFVSGVVSDRSNPRYFMAMGLIVAGIINIIFGFSSSFVLLLSLWTVNGWFQAWGWPVCTKQLTHWYGKQERGRWWSFCATSHNVGGALIPIMVAVCAQYYGWRCSMFVPGLIALLVGAWIIERMRDVPRTLGLPSISKYKNEISYNPSDSSKSLRKLSVKQILLEQVLSNKYVWLLSLSYFFVYVVRTAINDWSVLYLVEEKGYSLISAGISVSWFEIGGFFGILIVGWGSDILFNGRRVPFSILCAVGMVLSVFGFWNFAGISVWLDSLLMCLIGLSVFGPQMLIGLAAAEFVDKKAAGAANGFAGLLGYIGAAATGFPLGLVIDRWGWYGLFFCVMVCSVITFFMLLPMWSLKDARGTKHGSWEDADLKEVKA